VKNARICQQNQNGIRCQHASDDPIFPRRIRRAKIARRGALATTMQSCAVAKLRLIITVMPAPSPATTTIGQFGVPPLARTTLTVSTGQECDQSICSRSASPMPGMIISAIAASAATAMLARAREVSRRRRIGRRARCSVRRNRSTRGVASEFCGNPDKRANKTGRHRGTSSRGLTSTILIETLPVRPFLRDRDEPTHVDIGEQELRRAMATTTIAISGSHRGIAAETASGAGLSLRHARHGRVPQGRVHRK